MVSASDMGVTVANVETEQKAGSVFEADLEADLADPAFRALYELSLAKTNAMADLLATLEERREAQHLSKAEIGRRIHRRPSAISRLLNGGDQNPTWDTLVELAYAVGCEIEVRVKDAPSRSRQKTPVKVIAA
jgi:predicted XRE-type DNA-binding protein